MKRSTFKVKVFYRKTYAKNAKWHKVNGEFKSRRKARKACKRYLHLHGLPPLAYKITETIYVC